MFSSTKMKRGITFFMPLFKSSYQQQFPMIVVSFDYDLKFMARIYWNRHKNFYGRH